MASPVNELSDSSGPDEQQTHSQPPIKNQTLANGNIQQGVPAPPAMLMIPPTQLEQGHNMDPAAYPYINPYYGSIVAAYGGQAVMHPLMMGGLQPGVALPTDAVEEPVYVNARQYHGILRRRKSRAKAESENKLVKSRKPYLHESRHLHALKRERGCGGRFQPKQEDKSKSNNCKADKNTSCAKDRQSMSETASESNRIERPAVDFL